MKTDWSVDADVLMSERLFKTSSAESDVSKMIVVMRSACSQIVAWMGLAYEQQRRASSVQEELPSNVRKLHAARRQASNVTPLSTGPILVWTGVLEYSCRLMWDRCSRRHCGRRHWRAGRDFVLRGVVSVV